MFFDGNDTLIPQETLLLLRVVFLLVQPVGKGATLSTPKVTSSLTGQAFYLCVQFEGRRICTVTCSLLPILTDVLAAGSPGFRCFVNIAMLVFTRAISAQYKLEDFL